jgi:4-hydroxy-tetrahydrodipicolinate synthase
MASASGAEAYPFVRRPPGLRGVYPVAVTPFRDDEALDISSFRRLIRFLESAGCRGVTILGVLGESNRLVDFEREQLIEAAVTTAREICSENPEAFDSNPFHVCVGVSHSGTAAAVHLCRIAEAKGVDAVLVSPLAGSGGGDDDDSVLHLYQRIGDACPGLPIVVQDHPSSTGVHMSIPLLLRIVESVPTVACIKLESMPTLDRIATLKDRSTEFHASGCSILTGLGALYAGFDLASGRTDGFMTGFGFPEVLRVMCELVKQESQQERSKEQPLLPKAAAFAVYSHFLPLLVLEQQPGVGLAIRKEIFRRRKLIDSARVRHPGRNGLSPMFDDALTAQLRCSFKGVDISQPLSSSLILDLAGLGAK